ncbi:MAG: glycosyltransferase [Anaerolinea sp.]|nr:glycosyltransferase [Anaerolinea sp.]
MHILLVSRNRIPVFAYGGTERVIWDLGQSLHRLGHRVSYLVKPRSRCDFAEVLAIDKSQPLLPQVQEAMRRQGADIVHFQSNPFASPQEAEDFDQPWVMTEHGNSDEGTWYPRNVIFIARDHAARHGSDRFVYNGLDWSAYGKVDLGAVRRNFHFLGKGDWPFKNLQGAIDVALAAGAQLDVLGGKRLQTQNGWRFTWQPSIHFHGMVGGAKKFALLNASRGMVFPVRWHEPFGLAVVESLYFGCPVFATPYGAIPELVPAHCGVLSNSLGTLAGALGDAARFSAQACHEQARDHFNAERMARGYLSMYQRVLDGEPLHTQAPRTRVHPRDLPWLA